MKKPLSDAGMQMPSRRATLEEERVRQAEERVTDEKARIKDLAAKILRLRALREAKNAVQSEVPGGVVGKNLPKKRNR